MSNSPLPETQQSYQWCWRDISPMPGGVQRPCQAAPHPWSAMEPQGEPQKTIAGRGRVESHFNHILILLVQLQTAPSCSSSAPEQGWESSSVSGVSKPVQPRWHHTGAQGPLLPTPSFLLPSAWGQKPRASGKGRKEMGAWGWRGAAASDGEV